MDVNTRLAGNAAPYQDGANHQALAGVKVLDWSQLVAGPYCAKILADLGAETIKIERPEHGDEARHRAPFVHGSPHPEQSLLFLYLNTNKLGVTLDIESPSGRDRFMELIKWADVLVEDNTPRLLEGLKLTYDDLSQINPGLVMVSVTPFGQTGPYRDYKAHPINTYHGGGWGYFGPRASDGQAPFKLGGFFVEYACGLIGAVGTMGALYDQQVTGLGQQVDISKQEAILSLARVQVDRYANEGDTQGGFYSAVRRGPVGIFPCKDGYVVESGNQPHEQRALINLVTGSQAEKYEKYLDENFRQEHFEEIGQLVADWMMTRTKEEIYHQGQALGCPVGPVMTAKDIADSAQSSARQFFVEAVHPVAGRLKYPATPYRFSATPTAIERSAPLLGQHTEEVFSNRLHSGKQEPAAAAPVRQPVKNSNEERRRPLEGVRIADFSWAWAGAHSTSLLASLGAEVIKIESMQRVDFVRKLSFTTGQKFTSVDESNVFNDINLGKLGARLNLGKPRAIELAKQLVSISDVVVQNMRPGVMERLGLGYEALKAVKPDIIYLSSSSRGTSGPERGYSGYAPIFAALSGISHITGTPDGEPCMLAGEIDLLSAITSTLAMLAALTHRLKTGEGQHIDVSSSEAISVLIGDVLMDYQANGVVQTRQGNYDEIMAPHSCYRCQGEDKWLSIAVATDEEWAALCQALANPAWTREPHFSTAEARRQNQPELDRLIEQWTSNYSLHEAMEVLQQAGVAAVPRFNAEELFRNPHLNSRQCWTKVVHPVLGEQTVLLPPWKLSATPPAHNIAAPVMGQHGEYVFGELLGLSDEEIKRLEKEQVIY